MTLSRWHYIAAGLAVAALAIAGVLYGMSAKPVHADGAAPPATLAPFAAAKAPVPVPQVAIGDASGARLSLAAFKGRYVLLNLWAPWCAPCVRELPALAKLKVAAAGPRLAVIAVDVGRGTAADARSFLDDHDARALDTYVDSNSALLRAFATYGLPLTILIDPKGREIGRALGPAAWDSPEAIAWFKGLAAKP
ncbi:MAG: TlpA disulfide reductase family protein [Rhizomicrobium sp.]